MIIRNAEIGGEITDILIANGRIAQIGNDISGGRYFDVKGGALIPGLHDHHIHLNATAAAISVWPERLTVTGLINMVLSVLSVFNIVADGFGF